MAPTFSKEAILQGNIDHLCLACERYLTSERDVYQHVSTAEHRRNLEGTDYVDRYRNDRVRKVKKWYFCEFCNVLVSTMNSVGLHVENSRHVNNRSSQTTARVDDVIVSGNTAISEEAWHGFVDGNTCVICNVEYENRDDHKNEPGHVIKLIQSTVSTDNCYRKYNDTAFHCLICNEIVEEISSHLEETKHKQSFQSITTMPSNHKQDKYNCNSEEHKPKSFKYNKHSNDILDSIPKFQKHNININLETHSAFCRKCSINLEFDCKMIENHIEEHKNNKNKTCDTTQILFEKGEKDKSGDRGSSNASVKKNDSTDTKLVAPKQNSGGADTENIIEEHVPISIYNDRVLCQKCNTYIPMSVEEIRNHFVEFHNSRQVSSLNDRMVRKNGKKCNFKKLPTVQLFKSCYTVKHLLTADTVVNRKYCIDILSFNFLVIIAPGRFRCLVCESIFPYQNVPDHTENTKHKKLMSDAYFIVHPDLEFIRQIRSNTFQCGYCNIFDTWEAIEEHLKSSVHKETKAFAIWRLSTYLPKINDQMLAEQTFYSLMAQMLQ